MIIRAGSDRTRPTATRLLVGVSIVRALPLQASASGPTPAVRRSRQERSFDRAIAPVAPSQTEAATDEVRSSHQAGSQVARRFALRSVHGKEKRRARYAPLQGI